MTVRLTPDGPLDPQDLPDPSEHEVACLILGHLALQKFMRPAASNFDLLEIESMSINIGHEMFEVVGGKLIERDLLYVLGVIESGDQFTAHDFTITVRGLLFVNSNQQSIIEVFRKYTDYAWDQMVEFFEAINGDNSPEEWDPEKSSHDVSQLVPAADRFVEIDHNNPEIEEGIHATKEVIAGLRDSNEFKGLFANPDDSVVVLSEMEYGLSLIQAARACVETVRVLLTSRLEMIRVQMPDWAKSVTLNQALNFLWKFFVD